MIIVLNRPDEAGTSARKGREVLDPIVRKEIRFAEARCLFGAFLLFSLQSLSLGMVSLGSLGRRGTKDENH